MAQGFEFAKERYAEWGVDVEAALRRLEGVRVSMHCWQGDDVGGFENPEAGLGGGLAVTGNAPGKARTIDELRADLGTAFSLIPGRHRLNLHAIYGDFGPRPVPRDEIGPEHFRSWVEWCRERGLGLDFNATLFSHPLAQDGYTLSHPDPQVRKFWIGHVRRCREIASGFARELQGGSVHNLWIPDGAKDDTVERLPFRERLKESLDAIYDGRLDGLTDAVESKLFGIGSEAFVVGSHEFYLAYAMRKGLVLCLDMGHFHPTESVADKVSALAPFLPGLLFHVSRGVRWDSDHVVTATDEVRLLAREIVRAGLLDRCHLALDYFDASINRVGAWVIGMRSFLRTLLEALLEPLDRLQQAEGFERLALQEEAKALPIGPVWDEFCEQQGVPPGGRWTAKVREYEARVLLRRG
ncbi:MAG: L-rhamnose isomerase [Armatimonadetes bacterium]|nr:L-rhamnose isomerase [Armatimonadota bacterium]MCA1997964.1 L-rhamnose isomerase [Armatimonadota bacterium]